MKPTPAIDKLIAPLFCNTEDKPAAYIIDIDLIDAPMSIHRKLAIPSNMNLGYVQEVLMLAMGWQGYHLKEIHYGNIIYTTRYAGGQNPEPIEGYPQKDSFKYTIGDILKEEGDSFLFIYDLGDDWKHRVVLTRIQPYSTHQIETEDYWVQILSGEASCPPEDAGGVNGYKEILRIINTPTDEEYKDTLTWMGADFDPYHFYRRSTQARVDDFLRTIGEARWGFYRKS